MNSKKEFDCVRMTYEAQMRRAEALRGKSDDERLEYYRREHEELLKRQRELQTSREHGSDAHNE